MARPRKPAVEPTYTSVVASAVRLPVVTRNTARGSGEAWQAEAWRLYDRVGELRFVANWVGNMMSRTVLVAAQRVDGDMIVHLTGPESGTLADYFDGVQGQAEMLRQTGVHLTVAGECFHVYQATADKWSVLAVGKVRQTGSGAKARLQADFGDGMVTLTPGTDLVIRVWVPHPQDPQRADSPVQANLDTLLEIERTTQTTRAMLTSRLAGNGILILPNDITFPPGPDTDPSASTADAFMQVLGEAMLTPIANPDDASAVVPIVVTAPGENISQARHMTFAGELSEQVRLARDSAVARFALGMDIPPEVLTGMSNSNHWNAWLADESSVKAHVEPRLMVVAHAIASAYLQPALDNDTSWHVLGDTSAIRLRPNRSKEAIELWDRGELSGDTLRRETGFEWLDAPTPDEFADWLLRKVALGSTSPEQTQAALRALLGPGVLPVVPVPDTPTGRPSDVDNRRTVRTDRRTEGPEGPDGPDEALVAACDVLVYRALERAGNRLKSRHNYSGSTPAADLYLEFDSTSPDMLLHDAWSCLDRVLPGSHEALRMTLDTYTRTLLTTRARHDRDALRAHLQAAKALMPV